MNLMKIKLAGLILFFCSILYSAEPEYEFKMSVDENGEKDGKGEYLWSEPANWNTPPLPNGHVNIGNAEAVVHCVVKKTAAECGQLDLSEAGGPKGGVGNSLTIKDGGSLTVNKNFYCGKDKRGFLYIQEGGKLTVKAKTIVGFNRSTLGTDIIMNGGEFNTKGIHISATNPGVTEGSSMLVAGGSFNVSELLQVNSSKPEVPGILKICGTSSLKVDPSKGVTNIGYGILHVEGGKISTLNLAELKFEKGKDSKLKLSGESTTTICAKSASLGDAFLDVGDLNVKPGDYTILDSSSLNGNFTLPQDFSKSWKITYDTQKGDVILTKIP